MSEKNDSAGDVDFEWMKPQAKKQPAAATAAGADATAARPASKRTDPMRQAAKLPSVRNMATPEEAPQASAADSRPKKAEAVDGPGAGGSVEAGAEGSAEPGAEGSAEPGAEGSSVFSEPLPTTMLQIRPPQEDVDRRAAGREEAASIRPVLPRIAQVVLAICYPIVLLVLAIRAVASSLFLWIEYNRPGFPADSFGFSTDDRTTYGSYTLDYVLNFAGPRFLGDLVGKDHRQLFAGGEVSHMADVKGVFQLAFLIATVLGLIALITIIYLGHRRTGAVRRGLFAGSIATLVIIVALGVLGILGWETFFTDFHGIFFKPGTWTFHADDTLIRLFPDQFWMDAGLTIGILVFVVSSLTLALTWPTRRRRESAARALNPSQGRRAAS